MEEKRKEKGNTKKRENEKHILKVLRCKGKIENN